MANSSKWTKGLEYQARVQETVDKLVPPGTHLIRYQGFRMEDKARRTRQRMLMEEIKGLGPNDRKHNQL